VAGLCRYDLPGWPNRAITGLGAWVVVNGDVYACMVRGDQEDVVCYKAEMKD
jgi:hypothetical protein